MKINKIGTKTNVKCGLKKVKLGCKLSNKN